MGKFSNLTKTGGISNVAGYQTQRVSSSHKFNKSINNYDTTTSVSNRSKSPLNKSLISARSNKSNKSSTNRLDQATGTSLSNNCNST